MRPPVGWRYSVLKTLHFVRDLDLYMSASGSMVFKEFFASERSHTKKLTWPSSANTGRTFMAGHRRLKAGKEDNKKFMEFLLRMAFQNSKKKKIRFPETLRTSGQGCQKKGTERLVRRAAIKFAIENKKASVTLVHKSGKHYWNSPEGGFSDWGYAPSEEWVWWKRKLDGGHWMENNKDVIKIGSERFDRWCFFATNSVGRPDEYSVCKRLLIFKWRLCFGCTGGHCRWNWNCTGRKHQLHPTVMAIFEVPLVYCTKVWGFQDQK